MLKLNKYCTLGLLATSMVFFSCRTHKNIENNNIVVTEKKEKVEKTETFSPFNRIMNNAPKFTSLEGKVTFSATYNKKTYDIKGTVRILTDSCIYISLQPLIGIEMFRIQATKNEIVVIDRINSRYYKATYEEIKSLTGLFADFETMQALLCNQMFLTGISKEKMNKNMFEVKEFPDGYELKSLATLNDCPYLFNYITDKNYHIGQTTISQRKNTESFSCKYTNFMQTEKFTFPYRMELSAFDGKKTEKMSITFSKIELNKDLNLNLSIPAKYKAGDISQLKELL